MTPVTAVRSTATRGDAQRRADQIAAFGRELEELEREGLAILDPGEREAVVRHHAQVLAGLARQFDVDRSEPQRQMALGMRVASLLAAVALSAAVGLFFYRIWGLLATPAQVALLTAIPLALLAGTELAARREPSGYLAALLSVITAASFALDLSVVGAVFNTTPSSSDVAAWAILAIVVSVVYAVPLLFAGGLFAGLAWANAVVAQAAGVDWTASLARPEPLLLLAPLVLALSFSARLAKLDGFVRACRLVGLFVLFVPLLFLSAQTEVFSYRLLPVAMLHALFDVAGFVLPAAAIWWGVRTRLTDVVRASSGFLVLFAVVKCFDWWWDALPRYVFFLILGGLAIAAMLVLARLRRRLSEV